MIAAAWDATHPKRGVELLDRLSHAVGSPPDVRIAANVGALLAWSSPKCTAWPESSAVALGAIGGEQAFIRSLEPTELVGTFALLAFRDRELIAARGCAGGESLYLAPTNDGASVLACSRLEPLATALSLRQQVCEERVVEFVGGLPTERGMTFVRGVTRVHSDEMVRIGSHGIRRTSRPARILDEFDGISKNDLAIELRKIIFRVVARHVQRSEQVAVLAGGGLDSSGLLAAAVAAARGADKKEVLAVALDFAGPGDDRPYLRELAGALGVVPLRVAPTRARAFVKSSFVLDGAPMLFGSAPLERAMYDVARSHGADLVLTGVIGDDIFGGNPRILSRIAMCHPLRALTYAARLEVPWQTTALSRIDSFVARPLLRRLVPSSIVRDRRARDRGALLPWRGAALERAIDGKKLTEDASRPLEPRDATQRFAWIATAPMMMTTADARSQLESVTHCARIDPFLDEELLTFVARIPPLLLFDDYRHRGLYRLAMRGYLPEAVRMRADKAFFETAFTLMIQSAGGFSELDELARVSELSRRDVVRADAFASYWRTLKEKSESPAVAAHWSTAWRVLAAESFLRSTASGR